jgi:hypothetical protein
MYEQLAIIDHSKEDEKRAQRKRHFDGALSIEL